jgi:hypothetical protein
VLTKFEKEILSSEEKRKSVKPQTVRNTMQKVRNKAAKAIEDLLFLGNNAPLQLSQAMGFNRSGQLWSKKEFKTYRPGEQRRQIERITSKVLLKRLERQENAKWLALNFALDMGIIDEWLNMKELKEQARGQCRIFSQEKNDCAAWKSINSSRLTLVSSRQNGKSKIYLIIQP